MLTAACVADDSPNEDDEELGEAESSLLNIGTSISVTPSVNASVGNEVTAVAVPTSASTSVVFATYNSNFGVFLPDGNKTHCGWAKSNASQTSFTSYDSYYNPLPVPAMSSGTYERCLGDTWAAALGPQRLSQAVMVAVAESTDGTRDVVLWITNNAGSSFISATTISTAATGAQADGPKVAIDPTNNTAYVWWANVVGGVNVHYMRKVGINANGSVNLGPIVNLTNKLPGVGSGAPLHASITVRKGVGTALPRVFLAYPTAGMSLIPNCFLDASQTGVVNWYLAYSDNSGSTWTSHLVDTDPTFPFCQFQSPSNDEFLKRLGGNRSYISAVYDETAGRVILAYQRHEKDAGDNYIGTRINHAHWPSDPGGAGFDRWKPACNPAVCPPTGNCLVDGRLPIGETYCTQYGQSVAVRVVGGASQAVTVWHDTRDTPSSHPHPAVGDAISRNIVKSNIWGSSLRPGEPKDGCSPNCPKTQSRITPLSSSVPWLPTATNGNLWWGDYEQGIANLGNRFFAVWADNRDQSQTARLRGAHFDYGQAP